MTLKLSTMIFTRRADECLRERTTKKSIKSSSSFFVRVCIIFDFGMVMQWDLRGGIFATKNEISLLITIIVVNNFNGDFFFAAWKYF